MDKSLLLKRYVESVLSDCRRWYEIIIFSLVFEEGKGLSLSLLQSKHLDVLLNYLEQEEQAERVKVLLKDFEGLNQNMTVLSLFQTLHETDKKGAVHSFIDSHERFALHLRSCLEETGASSERDSETGLRLSSFLLEDYRKELKRFERENNSFCLCLLRSDALWNKEEEDTLSLLKPISEIVLSNLRVFDDAYRVDDVYILVSLKYARSVGAVKFYERVRRHFESMEKINGVSLSITGCITEPVSGQSLKDILQDMKKDLERNCATMRNDYIIMQESTHLQKFLETDE